MKRRDKSNRLRDLLDDNEDDALVEQDNLVEGFVDVKSSIAYPKSLEEEEDEDYDGPLTEESEPLEAKPDPVDIFPQKRTVPAYNPLRSWEKTQAERINFLHDHLESLSKERERQEAHTQAKKNLEEIALNLALAKMFQESENSADVPEENTVEVIEQDCLEAAYELEQKTGKICVVLNMANADQPGGFYLGGAGAQEENIFRRTDAAFIAAREEGVTVKEDKSGRKLPCQGYSS